MNKASFLSLVRQASRISDQEAEALEKLIVNFPYCQTAHLLIAKAAYDKGSMLSNQKLKKAAIYAANRQLLKKLIYTSDATVALQPVAPAEPEVKPEPVIPAIIAQVKASHALQTLEEELEESQAFVEAAVESETLSEPAEKEELLDPENLRVADTPAPTEDQETVIPAIPSSEIPETAVSNAGELTPEIASEKENIKASVNATALAAIESEALAEVAKDSLAHAEILVPENGIDPEEKTQEPEIEIPEKAILAEEIAIAEAFDEAKIDETEAPEEQLSETEPVEAEDVKEVISENQPAAESTETETTGSEEDSEKEETSTAEEPEIHPSPVLNDDLLHETLANFDQYLFRPEKETEETTQEEDLQVVVPENEIEAIYHNDTIGYWMNSSRMGESLEFKNELTTKQPYAFHPELIWEYNKTHELPKEIKPAPSKLSHQLDIIDNFLKMTPRLKAMAHQKVKTEAQEDLSSKSSKISKNLASENFANILVQQGKIKKAIKIYEHLILKIPEKKAYFVSQIEKLQNPE